MRQSRGPSPNREAPPERRRPPGFGAAHVLRGTLRFVDADSSRAAMLVKDGNAAGRRYVGRTVTIDLADAQLDVRDRNADGIITGADLLPGDQVIVQTRMPLAFAELPELIHVRRLSAYDPVAA